MEPSTDTSSDTSSDASSTLPGWAAGLGLRPHPEGGWYAETYRSGVQIEPPGYPGPRSSATSILFLLMPGQVSAWHRVRSDELWLHHRGGRLELVLGGAGDRPVEPLASAAGQRIVVGSDPSAGERLQALVPAGYWQRARPLDAEPVLVGCVVTPGFDFADFTLV